MTLSEPYRTFDAMVQRATGLNPLMLRWARERSGLAVDEVAERMSKPSEVVEQWESGGSLPTYRQLERLAEVVFKRPVALFFFPEPPTERDPEQEFRTLPSDEFEELAADTRYAIRKATAFQDSLRSLTGGQNPAERFLLSDVVPDEEESPIALAARVRDYLGVTIPEQQRWTRSDEAFKEWRQAVEDVGVFVFKRSFDQSEVSGFCLHDPSFPVIYINNSTAHSRQTFTLFHELGHLLFHLSGVTKEDDSYVGRLDARYQRIEVTCNQFASELLLPSAEFPWAEFEDPEDLLATVSDVADRFGVSREFVLRRLMDAGRVSRAAYLELAQQWADEFLEGRRVGGGGGNYYATQAAYLGPTFLNLAFTQYWAGRVSSSELADHLGIKARNLGTMEEFFLRTS